LIQPYIIKDSCARHNKFLSLYLILSTSWCSLSNNQFSWCKYEFCPMAL